MSLYLDASLIVPTLVEEESSPAVRLYLARTAEPWIIGALAAIEVASAISRLVRTNLASADRAQALLVDFDQWRSAQAASLDIQAADLRLAELFVRRFELGLRGPDALHLAACRNGDHTLVTLDRRLAIAAEALGARADCPN